MLGSDVSSWTLLTTSFNIRFLVDLVCRASNRLLRHAGCLFVAAGHCLAGGVSFLHGTVHSKRALADRSRAERQWWYRLACQR